FDEGLEEVVEEIQNKYPPGLCADHPNLPCYHHRRTGNHYELDRPKLLVWAAAKKTGSCTLDLPPLGSNLFKADKAIKRASPIAPPAVATGTPTPTLPPPAAPPQTPYPHPYGYYPPPPPMPLPPFGMYTPPMPSYYGHSPWQETPRRHRRHRSWDGGSSPPSEPASKRHRHIDPPSSPAPIGGSLDDFIESFPNLPEQTRGFLSEQGFQIGDDLSIVTDAQWKEAGFVLFGWKRVLDSYNQYKRAHKK
ncbi:hypothetical protein R3P38DRAFT_2519192, partial [Favolaschia claudopus]